MHVCYIKLLILPNKYRAADFNRIRGPGARDIIILNNSYMTVRLSNLLVQKARFHMHQ